MGWEDLERSIRDAKGAIKDIQDFVRDADGLIHPEQLELLDNAATEVERYLLGDAEDARIRIDAFLDE